MAACKALFDYVRRWKLRRSRSLGGRTRWSFCDGVARTVTTRAGRILNERAAMCEEAPDADCSGCIKRTGRPCHWVERDLCSACAGLREAQDGKEAAVDSLR